MEINALELAVLKGFLVFSGLMIGSFLNVLVYRFPIIWRCRKAGQAAPFSLSLPASHCPKCGHSIRVWHNIPVLGWLMLRGKCYDCKAPIHWAYMVNELIAGVASFAMVYNLNNPIISILAAITVWFVMIYVSWINQSVPEFKK